jgi:type IV pilus assembly protein PilC
MDFVCKVGTPNGDVIERAFSATDVVSLRAELERQGYYLFSVRRGFGSFTEPLRRRRVAPQLLLIFSQQMAALLKAGLPLLQSLDIMLERQKEPTFRRSLETVREKVKGGTAISEAFRAEGHLYPAVFAASLLAGERSGALEGVLRRFAQHLRLNEQLRKKAISASVYPLMLVVMMIVLTAILLVKVVPQFQGFFESLNAELPAPTRALLATSAAISSNIVLILGALAALAVVVVWWSRQEGAAAARDGALLRIPYFGGLARMYATSQLCRTLATLLSGGLPLVQALDVAASSIGNRAVGKAVGASTRLIQEGASLLTALEATRMFEALPLEMVKVGEQTGALAEMLSSVGDFYDEELENQLQAVLALVEPVLLVLMAVIVAGMLLAFYLPMFQAISAVQGR